MYLPASQISHSTAALPLFLPAGHVRHTEDDTFAAKVPALQSVHTEDSAAGLNLPATHCTQAGAALPEYWPAGQTEHTVVEPVAPR